jgi:hypothetical protein
MSAERGKKERQSVQDKEIRLEDKLKVGGRGYILSEWEKLMELYGQETKPNSK